MKKILIIISFIAVSISGIHAQNNVVVRAIDSMDSSKVFFAIKDSLKPDIYIDGVKYDAKILDMIDPEKIESINVIKGEAAIKEYNASNGAILITSKAASEKPETPVGIKIRASDNMTDKDPIVIVDGKVLSQEELKKISPSDIESITVLKDESAKILYNAPNGAIIITTKE